MFNEMIEIEKLSFDISADDLFHRVLNVINYSSLWPKELNCENRRITADGNIKIKKTDEIIRKTAFGGKLGLFIVAPLSYFSRIIISDRIKIDIFQVTADSSTMIIYLRIAKIINERVYSKEYALDYEQLKESFMNSGRIPEEIENTIAKIYKKLEKKKKNETFFIISITLANFYIIWTGTNRGNSTFSKQGILR